MARVKTSGLYLIGSFVLAAVASVLIASSVSSTKNVVPVVVVTTKLPAYHLITSQEVKLVQLPQTAVPTNASQGVDVYQQITDVVGKYTSESLEPKSMVRTGSLIHGVDRASGVLASKAQGRNLVMVAVPLQRNDLGSGVNAGDHVNIVGVMRNGAVVSSVNVPDLEVLKVDTGDKNNSSNGPSLWVGVPAELSANLEKAIVGGTIRCELLPKGEGAP